ncbi:MAG TPA: glycosyl transferase [Salinimicrobium sp.]|nr:glycosyl transferase [Salinimicrobium sp.]
MKLKEIPLSLFTAFSLRSIPVESLKSHSEPAFPIIVSLTTIESRLDKVHITIRSILAQKRKPKKILLWIPTELKNKIPQSLKKLTGDIVEIHFSHLHCSHKKLIHSLKLHPSEVIVTCDDDVMYRENWLKTLYNSHLKFPNDVIAHRVRCIRYENGELLPYKKWSCQADVKPEALLPIGAEGVLYPPETFSDVVFDEKLFLKLAPKADDLWFKAVALSNDKRARKAEESPELAIPLAGTQKISLKKENVDEDRNRKQWNDLAQYFGIDLR